MEDSNIQNQELAYDLRQRYAMIVGDHLDDVAINRKQKNYPNYFNALVDLYTIIEFRFKERSSKKKLSLSEIKELIEEFDTLENDLIKIANKNIDAWFGRSKDPEAISKIEGALRVIERYLYYKMNEAKMFGGKRDTEGLV